MAVSSLIFLRFGFIRHSGMRPPSAQTRNPEVFNHIGIPGSRAACAALAPE
jgi:hypothetical protein